MTQALSRPVRLLDDERGLHLYPLLKFLLKELGPEFIGWDSVALRLELEERWGDPGPVTWERIQAGRVMTGHDGFWIHMEIFENCGLALVGEIPVFSHFQPLEAESIAVIFKTAEMIREHPFSGEVLRYALSCCLEDTTWYLEEPLDILLHELFEFDKERGVVRNHDSVQAKLQRVNSPIANPLSFVDVQVNNVLSVRETLAGYTSLINQQIKELGL